MTEPTPLEFTGERFTPECVREIAYEHWHRYAWMAQWVAGKQVLDAACGEGYGSFLLSRSAGQVTGVDIATESIAHARRRYRDAKLNFIEADCTALPLDDHSIDVVVSFETLEHLADHDKLLGEFRRVLRPEGFVAISSPDRKTYSDASGYNNPFHVRELYREEFESLLAAHFPAWRLFGQKLAFASVLWSMERAGGHEWLLQDHAHSTRSEQPALPPMYYLALAAASEQSLPAAPGLSLYGDREESVYAHYNDVVRKHIRAEHLLAERDAELAALRQRLAAPWWRRLLARS